jgi:multidrug resistance efflux pump
MERVFIPERIGRRRRLGWSRWVNRWPFIVWFLAIFFAVFFYYHGGRFGGMSGVVQSFREEVAPLETARLLSLAVQVGQTVKAGDLLAQMDPSILDAEMAVEKLQAQRRFVAAVAGAEADLQDAQIRQAETLGELEVLNSEVTRQDELLNRRLVDAQDVARLRSRQGALSRAAELYPAMIQRLEKQVALAQQQMEDAEAGYGPGGTNTAADGRSELGLLQLRRNAYTLRAREAGIVSQIYSEPGDVVQGGTPLMTVVSKRVGQITGCLPESNARHVAVGMTVYLAHAVESGAVVRGRIVALTPEILALPNRVNPSPNQGLRGRRVIILPEEGHDFLPGEGVSIELERPWLTLLIRSLRTRLFGAPESGGS